ncbi:N-formylglutamate amidohydrolase [Candidatus Riflebacteria bacterium]
MDCYKLPLQNIKLIFTCEHAGNYIPPEFKIFFQEFKALLHSHRGMDFGALSLARSLSAHFAAPLHYSRISRLLIELNRNKRHPMLFSHISKALENDRKQYILRKYYDAYRQPILTDVPDKNLF